MRSDDPRLARKQDRWCACPRGRSPLGCNCNRATLAAIERGGLDVEHKRMGVVPKAPKIVSPLLVGSAVRGDVL